MAREKEQTMSAHYEFQKQQVQDQIAARMQEAERHRMTKAAQGDRPGIVPRLSVPINSFRSVLVCSWRRRGAHTAEKSDEIVGQEQLVS
jgi:hypothetical protein